MKRLLILLAFFALPLTAFSADKIADFTLSDIEGQRVKLSEQLKKGPVLLDFWATWCKPCVQELPHIQEFHKKYSGQGLQVITVTIDNPKTQSKVKPFIKSAGYTFRVLLDGDLQVRQSLGGKDIPLTLLIDQNGELVHRHLGYVAGDEKKLETMIQELLKKSAKVEAPKPAAEGSDK